jgi:hypothetical protein
MGKYGTNLEGFGAFEGGVNADKGAPLVSTSSDGETSLLFGPAALREIQAGVANGDFAIPPDAAGDTITEENPLPYWTFTDVNSAGAITCAVVADATAGSGNVLRWTIANNTPSGRSAKLTRYVPVASSRDRASINRLIVGITNIPSTANANVTLTQQYVTADLTNTGTAGTTTNTYAQLATAAALFTAGVVPFGVPGTQGLTFAAPSDAAYIYLTITIATVTATVTPARTIDLCEVRMIMGTDALSVAEAFDPATYYPATIYQENGTLKISNGATSTSSKVGVLGDIGLDGQLHFDSSFTGATMILGGTNGRLFSFSNSSGAADVVASAASARSGVLITKVTAGQPTTNINGTATTDAFADALRNGGLAVDTTNNRGYFYSNGWKYAALTTPSDSRLKEEISDITGALDTLRQLMPVAFKWKRPEAHGRAEAVGDDGTRLGFIADQVATTDLKHWVETLGVDDREADLVDTTEVLAVNIPQNEMEALVVQALLDIDARLKALESR